MAQRRMFSNKITDTDMFLEMPLSTQALYFHLNMGADDDGFIGNAKTIKRKIGANDNDYDLLVAKQFIFAFDDGIVVVKDWRIHNYIQKDRYNETQYIGNKSMLSIEKNGMYTKRVQNVSTLDTQVRLGEVSLGEVSKDIVEQKFIFPRWLSKKEVESVKKGKTENYEVKVPIAYLNKAAGKQYRFVEKSTKLVHARIAEGFTLDDFKTVIDTKVAEWISDANMNKYLRPETLFGNKFESYLNQTKSNIPDTYGDEYSIAKLGF